MVIIRGREQVGMEHMFNFVTDVLKKFVGEETRDGSILLLGMHT